MLNNKKTNEQIKLKRITKQTHDIKLADNLSPITKKLTEVNESLKKLEVLKNSDFKNETPQLAIENTPNDFLTGVLYDPSSEHTLTTMKKANIFLR